MGLSTYPGWEDKDGKLEASFQAKVQDTRGGTFNNELVSVVNPNTGAYDVYYNNRSALGISFGRTLLYSYSPSTNKAVINKSEKDLYNRVFSGKEGTAQFNRINGSIKDGTIRNLQLNATDPIVQKNLAAIKETPGYKSKANTVQPTDPDVQTKPPENGDDSTSDTGDTGDTGSGTTELDDGAQQEAASKPAEALKLEVGSSKGTRSANFGDYIYPLDLGASTQDVIKFTMLEYIPTDISMSSGAFGIDSSARKENRNSIGTVILPIPGGIQDSNKVNWSGQNMNALEIAAANFALNTIQSGIEGATAATKNIVNAVVGGSEATKTAVGTILAGQAAGVGQQLVTRTTGAIINPNLELLFGGPTLRQFSFKFKMTPRESDEAKEIAKIIRFFKQGSAAQRTKANLFLKSPHTFQIQYLYRGPEGRDNPYMNKIKECACTGVSVNYTPENNYATFSDGAMTSYDLTLSFGELEPIFNDDYGDGAFPAEIGF